MASLQEPALLPPMAGLSLVAQLAQARQRNELALYQMAQDAALQQKKFEIDKEKIIQEKPVIDAQTESYKAMANLHNAQAKAYTNGVGNAAQRKQQTLKEVGDFTKELSTIQSPKGTTAWQHEADLIAAKYPDIAGTTEFARVWNSQLLEHNRAATQNRVTQNSIVNNYRKFLSDNGLSPYAFENPDMWGNDPKGKGKYLVVDAKTGAIQPPATDVTGSKGAFRAITIPTKRWDTLLQQHKAINDIYDNMLFAPDPQNTARPAREVQQIPVVSSDDDFDALPPGSYFVDPNGKTRQKPQ
jgi:hypothetical protein